MENKLYRCPICGNIICLEEGKIDNITCCGKTMEEIIPNTIDASHEKHVPAYMKQDNEIIVTVGEIEHPMEENHFIMWILYISKNKTIRVNLTPAEKPVATFPYEKGATIYAYCNLHGLWKKDVE